MAKSAYFCPFWGSKKCQRFGTFPGKNIPLISKIFLQWVCNVFLAGFVSENPQKCQSGHFWPSPHSEPGDAEPIALTLRQFLFASPCRSTCDSRRRLQWPARPATPAASPTRPGCSCTACRAPPPSTGRRWRCAPPAGRGGGAWRRCSRRGPRPSA